MDCSDKEGLGDVTVIVADITESVDVDKDVVTLSMGAEHRVATGGSVEGITEPVNRESEAGEAGAAVLARAAAWSWAARWLFLNLSAGPR